MHAILPEGTGVLANIVLWNAYILLLVEFGSQTIIAATNWFDLTATESKYSVYYYIILIVSTPYLMNKQNFEHPWLYNTCNSILSPEQKQKSKRRVFKDNFFKTLKCCN